MDNEIRSDVITRVGCLALGRDLLSLNQEPVALDQPQHQRFC